MLENLKSIYFLQNIFTYYINKKKLLSLIFRNKKLQKKLNISISDYKKHYNQIEIDINLIAPEKYKGKKNIFLNRLDNKKDYYHIYFDNNPKEIKRRYATSDDKIDKIKILIDEEIDSLKELFYGCDCIKEINFIKFNRKNITNMISMFEECSSLEKLNLKQFKTDNVNNIKSMFRGCILLTELDLSSFNTAKIENMQSLFYECMRLEKINISNFDTSNTKNMSYMFYGCSSLKELNIRNFNTNKVKDMSAMFYDCFSLKDLNINFTTEYDTNISFMFFGCSSLINLDLSNFKINENANTESMFVKCSEELKNNLRNKYKYIKDNAFRVYI